MNNEARLTRWLKELGEQERTMNPMSTANKVELLSRVYDAVYRATESFEHDLIGVDLAYLMGAIVKDTMVSWGSGHPILAILRAVFQPEHCLWRYIEIDQDDDTR